MEPLRELGLPLLVQGLLLPLGPGLPLRGQVLLQEPGLLLGLLLVRLRRLLPLLRNIRYH